MRILLLGAVAALSIANAANAQALREISTSDTIDIRAGQAKTYMFDQAVGRFALSAEGVAEITPETDRTFIIKALNPGQVLMTAYAPDGHVLQRSNITVTSSGHLVRIYGSERMKSAKDYVGFVCTDSTCGRADPDIGPRPYSTSVSESQNKGVGGSVPPEK